MSEQPPCRHCTFTNPPHTRRCVCGHIHNDHCLFGPCTVKKCDCNKYDQRRLAKQEQDEKSDTGN